MDSLLRVVEAMPLDFEDLKPYKSYVLLEMQKGAPDGDVLDAELMNEILQLLKDVAPRSVSIKKKHMRHMKHQVGDLQVGFLHYSEARQPAWSSTPEVKDVLQQLVVVARLGSLVALYASDKTFGGKVLQATKDPNYPLISQSAKIPTGRLNMAFVNGEARMLWLTGTHRRVPVKADFKVLSGLDLRHALDPLEDQTYHFSSARCHLEQRLEGISQIGVTPRKSKTWIGPTKDWDEFIAVTDVLMEHLSTVTQKRFDPLPVLSIPTESVDGIEAAFDIALAPPEMIAEVGLTEEERQKLERWASLAVYNVEGTEGADFSVLIDLGERCLGKLNFQLDESSLPTVRYTIDAEPSSDSDSSELLSEATKYLSRKSLLNVWYESGHTIHGGYVFVIRHRDIPFKNIRWERLENIDVSSEKPDPILEVGQQDSLFCWVKRNWSDSSKDTWLACDDGAMEIADFIYLEDEDPPQIILIHVKAAKNDSPNRGISVSAYEVVTAQAVKNVRYLDRLLLTEGLQTGLQRQVSNLVWHNGADSTRREMLSVLGDVGADVMKKLVVLQPHVTRARHEAARSNMDSSDGRRLRQLDTLLLGAQANAGAAGADFEVVMQD
jgi:hypothetical protein